MRRLVLLISLLLTALVASPGPGERLASPEPIRIVLFVADGAGVAYWSAARREGELAVADFPVVALLDPTSDATDTAPESASSATAMATGVATVPRGVGVGPDGRPVRSVLEVAEEAGLATGLVTTTFVTDATPAAFATHVRDRYRYDEIARQLADSGVEVLLGDGLDQLERPGQGGAPGPLDRLASDGRPVVRSPEELHALEPGDHDALVGLFDIDSIADPTRRHPSLAEMTDAALSVLGRDPEGFFVLVENEHTDHRGHDNADLDVIRAEIRHLDRAVRRALAYRRDHPELVVLVAADHETGGLALVPDPAGVRGAWHTGGHTHELVPLFAIGPGTEALSGIHPMTAVGRFLVESVRGDR